MGVAKSYCISKNVVAEAWRCVRANKGSAGVDKESIEEFEKDLKNNLYKIWNRMSSGTTFLEIQYDFATPISSSHHLVDF